MSVGAAQGSVAVRIRTLAGSRYPEWDTLVARSPHGSLFHSSWWLEASGWPFEIVAAEDAEGKIVAGIPLPHQRIAGLKLIYTPPLTPFLGPVFRVDPQISEMRQLGFVRSCGEELANFIRDYDAISQWIGANGSDLQGFLWAGFRVEISYTFRFERGTPSVSILKNADVSQRQHVRHAERTGTTVEVTNDVERLLCLNRLTFERQGKQCPWSDDLVRTLWKAATLRKAVRLYVARTAAGEDAAAVLVVNDETTSYQLLAGNDPQLRISGAGSLVTLRAVTDALNENRAYDFEGSELRGVESYFRHWGANPKPIWRLERAGTFAGALARLWRRRSRYKQHL